MVDIKSMTNDELMEYIATVENEVKDILKTLPISYYLGRNIEVSLSDRGRSTYFDAMHHKIVIGMTMVLQTIVNMAATCSREKLESTIRAFLYHEVSHAILTPSSLMDPWTYGMQNIYNIFEDERIETFLKDYYKNVNFKENVKFVNDYVPGTISETPEGHLYRILRFREPEYPKDKDLIKKAVNMFNTTVDEKGRPLSAAVRDINTGHYYLEKNPLVRNYQMAIEDFYCEASIEWCEENAHDFLIKINPKYDSLDYQGKKEVVWDYLVSRGTARPGELGINPEGKDSDPGKKRREDEPSEDGSSSKLDSDEEPENESDGSASDGKPKDESDVSVTETKPSTAPAKGKRSSSASDWDSDLGKGGDIEETPVGNINDEDTDEDPVGNIDEDMRELVKHIFKDVDEQFIDQNLTNELTMLFTGFNKRTLNNGTASYTYSGALDPRKVGAEDWKIWKHQSTNGNIKGYSKLHLGLFIDVSGSYKDNEFKTNVLLHSLAEIEKKVPYFSFDLVTCAQSEELKPKNDRFIFASGGNRFDDKIWPLYNKIQKSDAYNINIILFDGDAESDSYNSKEEAKNFEVFNNGRCSIISDPFNEKYFKKWCARAHIKYTSGGEGEQSYASELFKNVKNAIQSAFNG